MEEHDQVFVIEQNRDAQFRSLLINELEVSPQKMISVLNYDGMPITADTIMQQIMRNSLTYAAVSSNNHNTNNKEKTK
jgi:2-oxoglutarate ferredoxin oxidoreductase subunit alpha